MSPQPLGVAVAGLGFGEKVHLPALAAATDLEAVALWHPRQERLDAATAAHGLKGFSDWDALLADPAVDAVIIATPPAPRFDLARRALEAGKHLLLEKPIALHADQARELQRLALARGCRWLWTTNTALCPCSCRPHAFSRPVPSAHPGW